MTEAELVVYDEKNPALAYLLSRLGPPEFPTPVGVFLSLDRPTYEQGILEQLADARSKGGEADVDQLLRRGDTWTVA